MLLGADLMFRSWASEIENAALDYKRHCLVQIGIRISIAFQRNIITEAR